MQHIQEQLLRMQEKLQQLVQLHQHLQKENSRLKQELAGQKLQFQNQVAESERLKMRLEILESAKQEMDPENKKQFEKRLALYVKEIDKCIALLNE